MFSVTEKNWKQKEISRDEELTLAHTLNITEITARILVNRGIKDTSSAQVFLKPSLKWLSSPFLFPQIALASEILTEHIIHRKKIAIYGDYDVDGITGTVILVSFLNKLGADVIPYIPDRLIEGYGLNKRAIAMLKSMGVNLIITVDCGITNHSEVIFAKREGLSVIITDHHEVPLHPPPADAVINPKDPQNSFPFRELSGVGVAFYLAIATRRSLLNRGILKDGQINLREYLDLVALGTICDIVPLINENRIFAKLGLTLLENSPRAGIMALKEVSGITEGISCEDVAFRLGPRINAGSRLSSADAGLHLLLENNIERAKKIASQLNSLNQKRQAMEEKIFDDAVKEIESRGLMKNKTIVLYNENWHPGVIGIVASRLSEHYWRPTILIALKDRTGKGSGRGIPGLNLVDALKNCKELLIAYGGHKYAAGITISKENIPAFAKKFEESVSNSITEDDLTPELLIDAKISMKDLNKKLCSELELLEPFGTGNPEPNLLLDNVKIIDKRIAGNNHLMLKVTDGENIIDAVGFGLGDKIDHFTDKVDIIFYPELNNWNGNERLRLRIKDIRKL